MKAVIHKNSVADLVALDSRAYLGDYTDRGVTFSPRELTLARCVRLCYEICPFRTCADSGKLSSYDDLISCHRLLKFLFNKLCLSYSCK